MIKTYPVILSENIGLSVTTVEAAPFQEFVQIQGKMKIDDNPIIQISKAMFEGQRLIKAKREILFFDTDFGRASKDFELSIQFYFDERIEKGLAIRFIKSNPIFFASFADRRELSFVEREAREHLRKGGG